MKQVGIKIENKGVYHYYYSAYRVEEALCDMVRELEENMAIEIKCGREHHYIDYDEEQRKEEIPYAYDIARVMYYVKERLGSHS